MDTYIHVEKITDMASLISYKWKFRDVSPLTIDDKLVMVYTSWQHQEHREILTRSLHCSPETRFKSYGKKHHVDIGFSIHKKQFTFFAL